MSSRSSKERRRALLKNLKKTSPRLSDIVYSGPHASLVKDVIDFATSENLLVGADELGDSVVQVTSLDEAGEICRRPQRYSRRDPLSWPEIRENEMARLHGIRYKLADFTEANRVLNEMLEPLQDIIKDRIDGSGFEFSDDVQHDFFYIVYSRAVTGVTGSLFDKVFEMYQCGGWPCGWVGHHPKGKLAVYSGRIEVKSAS